MNNKKGNASLILIVLIIIIIILFLLIITFNKKEVEQTNNISIVNNLSQINISTYKIASWNLQIFGTTKAKNENVLNFYDNKLSEYDIIFVQEIRDSSNTAFNILCSRFEGYKCTISEREGRTTSKEQVGIIYKEYIDLISVENVPDTEDVFERSPTEVVFNLSDNIIVFYNFHSKPDDVKNELAGLEKIVTNNVERTIILGDLNADCSYFDNSKSNILDDWVWLIKDNIDTTVADSSCAYDRIIVQPKYSTEQYIKNYGVDSVGINKTYSDHYIIYLEIGV